MYSEIVNYCSNRYCFWCKFHVSSQFYCNPPDNSIDIIEREPGGFLVKKKKTLNFRWLILTAVENLCTCTYVHNIHKIYVHSCLQVTKSQYCHREGSCSCLLLQVEGVFSKLFNWGTCFRIPFIEEIQKLPHYIFGCNPLYVYFHPFRLYPSVPI